MNQHPTPQNQDARRLVRAFRPRNARSPSSASPHAIVTHVAGSGTGVVLLRNTPDAEVYVMSSFVIARREADTTIAI